MQQQLSHPESRYRDGAEHRLPAMHVSVTTVNGRLEEHACQPVHVPITHLLNHQVLLALTPRSVNLFLSYEGRQMNL